MIAGMDRFERLHALAPQATLRFQLLPRLPTTALDGITLRVAGDSVSLPVEVAPDHTFTLPRDDRALAQDAALIASRKTSTLTWRAQRTVAVQHALRGGDADAGHAAVLRLPGFTRPQFLCADLGCALARRHPAAIRRHGRRARRRTRHHHAGTRLRRHGRRARQTGRGHANPVRQRRAGMALPLSAGARHRERRPAAVGRICHPVRRGRRGPQGAPDRTPVTHAPDRYPMKNARFFLPVRAASASLLLLVASACASPTAPATAPVAASAAPAPGLDGLWQQIQAASASNSCDNDSQCHTIGVGAKACGGPERYLPWSSQHGDGAELKRLVAQHAAARRAADAREGMMSTCSVVSDPGATCRANRCTLNPRQRIGGVHFHDGGALLDAAHQVVDGAHVALAGFQVGPAQTHRGGTAHGSGARRDDLEVTCVRVRLYQPARQLVGSLAAHRIVADHAQRVGGGGRRHQLDRFVRRAVPALAHQRRAAQQDQVEVGIAGSSARVVRIEQRKAGQQGAGRNAERMDVHTRGGAAAAQRQIVGSGVGLADGTADLGCRQQALGGGERAGKAGAHGHDLAARGFFAVHGRGHGQAGAARGQRAAHLVHAVGPGQRTVRPGIERRRGAGELGRVGGLGARRQRQRGGRHDDREARQRGRCGVGGAGIAHVSDGAGQRLRTEHGRSGERRQVQVVRCDAAADAGALGGGVQQALAAQEAQVVDRRNVVHQARIGCQIRRDVAGALAERTVAGVGGRGVPRHGGGQVVAEGVVGAGHQGRLDGGRAPGGVALLEQRGHAGHVRRRHRGAGQEAELHRLGRIAGGNRVALGLGQARRHGSQDVGAGGGHVRFQDVGVGHVRAARRRRVHHRRIDRRVDHGVQVAQRGGRTGVAGDIGLQDGAVFLGDVHGGQRVRLVQDGGGAAFHVGDDRAHGTGGAGIGALVDQHVAATVADQDLAGHLGRVEQGRLAVGAAEALVQRDQLGGGEAGHARVLGQDQQRRRGVGVARRAGELGAGGQHGVADVQAVVGGVADRRQPWADVAGRRRRGRARTRVAGRGGDEHAGCGRAQERLFGGFVEGAAAGGRADREVDHVDAVLDGLVDGGHAVGRGAAAALGRIGPAHFVGGNAGARRHAAHAAQADAVDDGIGIGIARHRGGRVAAVTAFADGTAQRVAGGRKFGPVQLLAVGLVVARADQLVVAVDHAKAFARVAAAFPAGGRRIVHLLAAAMAGVALLVHAVGIGRVFRPHAAVDDADDDVLARQRLAAQLRPQAARLVEAQEGRGVAGVEHHFRVGRNGRHARVFLQRAHFVVGQQRGKAVEHHVVLVGDPGRADAADDVVLLGVEVVEERRTCSAWAAPDRAASRTMAEQIGRSFMDVPRSGSGDDVVVDSFGGARAAARHPAHQAQAQAHHGVGFRLGNGGHLQVVERELRLVLGTGQRADAAAAAVEQARTDGHAAEIGVAQGASQRQADEWRVAEAVQHREIVGVRHGHAVGLDAHQRQLAVRAGCQSAQRRQEGVIQAGDLEQAAVGAFDLEAAVIDAQVVMAGVTGGACGYRAQIFIAAIAHGAGKARAARTGGRGVDHRQRVLGLVKHFRAAVDARSDRFEIDRGACHGRRGGHDRQSAQCGGSQFAHRMREFHFCCPCG
uniref:Uncharacterized protein n=1 Tax=Tanacetum cinerariifolium TaxID=118510 RepID=A0A699GF73_TANCI|nr:hypothetical protein [Tanacetum cinerariifolium]